MCNTIQWNHLKQTTLYSLLALLNQTYLEGLVVDAVGQALESPPDWGGHWHGPVRASSDDALFDSAVWLLEVVVALVAETAAVGAD